MKDFSTLLKRAFLSLNRDSLEKESVLSVLKNTAGITLKPGDIFIKDGVLEITASPVVKNEIKIKEEKLLQALKESHNLSYARVLYK